MTAHEINVFTDGSCLKNPDGPGGWAVIVEHPDGSGRRFSGCDPCTTNNRMEMMAALQGLVCAKERFGSNLGGAKIILYTDSQYVQLGMSSWLPGWKRGGWLTSQGKEVKNEDLWRILDAESYGLVVEWRWVRGHAGHRENELVDKMAKYAAANQTSEEVEFEPGDLHALQEGDTKKRAGPIEVNPSMSDADLAGLIRASLAQARGRIVRLRETG